MAIDVNGHCRSVHSMSSSPNRIVVFPDTRTSGVDLPPTDRAAALARRTVTEVLRGWRIGNDDWTYDVLLVTSELVGNAVRHAGRRVALQLALDSSHLTVSVTDGSSVLPSQRRADADESGRGLSIVDALAEEWGAVADAAGKTVWARLPLVR
jgi:anti-sigma regulatory factor (Ser/Thr protein kinase)